METKSPLKPKAVELLRRVQKHILAEPKRYDQGRYASRRASSPCGTAACIAGWCDVLRVRPRPSKRYLEQWLGKVLVRGDFTSRYGDNIPLRAARALGTVNTASLFNGEPDAEWPEPFSGQWHKSRTALQRARIAAARIEYFIKTGE